MPMTEIDETELHNLRGLQQVLAQIEKHPEARALAQKAVSIAAPDRAGPEVKIRSEFDERFSKVEGMITSFVDEQKKTAAERETAAQRAALEARWMEGRATIRKSGYTGEGLEAVEKLMEERGIADHEAGVALFERQNPPPAPLISGGNRWDWAAPDTKNTPDLKPLYDGNEDAFLGPAIANAIKEVREGR